MSRAPDAARRFFSAARQSRGPELPMLGPGSASRHFMPRRVRDTRQQQKSRRSSRRLFL